MLTILFWCSIGINVILFLSLIGKKKPIQVGLVNFENDIQFLLFLIYHKLNQIEKFFLEPSQIARSMFITDEDFTKYQIRVIEDIINSISPHYKNTLMKYFTEKSLQEHIAEVIMRELSVKCVKMNLSNFYNHKSVKKMSKMKDQNGDLNKDPLNKKKPPQYPFGIMN